MCSVLSCGSRESLGRKAEGRNEATELREKELPPFLRATKRETVGIFASQVEEVGTGTQQCCLLFREKQEQSRSLVRHSLTFRNYQRTVAVYQVIEAKLPPVFVYRKHKRILGAWPQECLMCSR